MIFSSSVEKWTFNELWISFLNAPTYHLAIETFFLIWIIYLLFNKSYRIESDELTPKEIEELIQEWNPEPLVPETPQNHYALNPKLITSNLGKYVEINNRKCLNLASHNYLGLADNELLKSAAIEGLKKYGVGSCGPRGFYGTFDIHLELEKKLADFLRVEEVVLYSYAFSTVASAIPAYSKIGDVIFCDEGVHFAIQKGLTASRSQIKFFKHNNVKDLEKLLKEQEELDLQNIKKANVTRKFLVVEGLYLNYGDICPLEEIMNLKIKYKFRLFIDETVSFGTLGATGRGVTEHFNIPIEDVDHISASLENSICAYGGFCAGSTFIVDHQRLSGLGYIFSASLPPLQAAVACCALDILESDKNLTKMLEKNCKKLHQILSKIDSMSLESDDISPIKHLRLLHPSDKETETKKLESICDFAWKNNVSLVVARYLENEKQDISIPRPSIRLIVNASLTDSDLVIIGKVLKQAFDELK